MTRAELKMLERLYAAEIEGALGHSFGIVQSKSMVLPKLEAEGLARRVERTVSVDRFGPVTVKGWELTLSGNLAYCMHCGDGDRNG